MDVPQYDVPLFGVLNTGCLRCTVFFARVQPFSWPDTEGSATGIFFHAAMLNGSLTVILGKSVPNDAPTASDRISTCSLAHDRLKNELGVFRSQRIVQVAIAGRELLKVQLHQTQHM